MVRAAGAAAGDDGHVRVRLHQADQLEVVASTARQPRPAPASPHRRPTLPSGMQPEVALMKQRGAGGLGRVGLSEVQHSRGLQ